jgi:hypothetical protein
MAKDRSRSGPTQRITGSDLADGRIRIPAATKELLPSESVDLDITLKGDRLSAHWNPRFGPDRERSGVLSTSRDALRRLVREDEVLTVVRTASGAIYVGDRGSKLRIAQWVNDAQPALNARLLKGSPTLQVFLDGNELEWVSPLFESDLRELSDDLWAKMDFPDPTPTADDFWPKGQPHWDAVARLEGRYGANGILLIEAKSHTNEVISSCGATAVQSRDKIDRALDEAKTYIGAPSTADWKSPYYQAANRFAFLYYLRARRNIPAWLFFVYFIGDAFEVEGVAQPCPSDEKGWTSVIDKMHQHLGLPACHPLTHFSHDVFLPAEPSQH